MTTRSTRMLVRAQRLRMNVDEAFSRVGIKGEYFLVILSILIGAATGLFASLFFFLIEEACHFAYGHGDESGLFGGRLWMVVALPVVGGLLVGHITYYFAREAKGHGVPEVMDAMYRKGGVIRPRVAMAKSIASALTIGSGGSAGMEGPIIQIGAAVGSSVGQFLRVHRREMNILVACGASAGIAAIFNAPIAGVLFALEIFLKDFSFRTFSPVVFSSVISCSVTHALRLEDKPIFEVLAFNHVVGDPSAAVGLSDTPMYMFVGVELPLFLILGVFSAIAAVLFIRSLYLTEDLFDKIKLPQPFQPALGALGLGISGVVFLLLTQSTEIPPFFANGYPAIEQTMSRAVSQMTVWGLLLLCGLKIFATCCTLGSGGSGGIFAPSLFVGATLGGAFGLVLSSLNLIEPHSVAVYALVGMAALVAGTTHAPLTAIVMLWEITREPTVILPVMFAAVVATAGAQWMCRDSIYTLKLRRRGVRVGNVVDLTILRRITASDVDVLPAQDVHPEDPLQRVIDLASETDANDFVVVDEHGVYQGMVIGKDVRTALLQPEAVSLLVVAELVRSGVPTVTKDETLDSVLDKFSRKDVESLPLSDSSSSGHIVGLITRQAVMRRYQLELDSQG